MRSSSAFSFDERHPRDDRGQMHRMASREEPVDPYRGRYEYQYAGEKPPPHPRGHGAFSPSSRYPHSLTPRSHLQSVVTTSFSIEDEREDRGARRFGSVERRSDVPEREDVGHSEREDHYYAQGEFEAEGPRASPSERASATAYLQRSFSAGSAKFKSEPMKRSYYHHSRPNEVQTGQLPADFMPPKRVKLEQSNSREMMVTPRSPPGGGSGEWYARAPTWESEEDPYARFPRAQSFPPTHQPWGKPVPSPMSYRGERQAGTPKDHTHVSPGSETESPRHWQGSDWGSPSSRPPTSGSTSFRFWDSSPTHRGSDDYESPRMGRPQMVFQRRPMPQGKMQLVVDAAAAAEPRMEERFAQHGSTESIMLLALPQDRVALSETLCVVRENIEVFTATQADVDAPAPGRKHAVVVGQVGLRCIHCRHTIKCSDRVKRAVCYPSSIKRIYRTVIDMKLDHFSQCRFVPDGLKSRLHQLKAVQTRSTGTTMQYFIRAAHALGMEDGPSGVRLSDGPKAGVKDSSEPATTESKADGGRPSHVIITRTDSISGSTSTSMDTGVTKRTDSMMSTESFDSGASPGEIVHLDKYYEGCVPLSLPEDKTSLSPLRCFLREQVCAFSATEEDIAVRAPTTFSICVGQVGIGCIHCVKQPAKLRSNRAVCFPFSIGRIYQSVADIQRFHFTECKMLPADVKEKFLELQSASSKGSKGLATRQYWVTSAKKIGLVDTKRGIRFGRDPTQPETAKAFSLDILAQAAFTVTTANKQLVVPEDKETIAEFLYVVMEQLQPCRFTEADRNKRRLKDVGCIGVECKHCARQVDSRKFFWSSVNAVESNFVSVHTHMLECRMVPDELKQRLAELKLLRKEQTAALKTGSQKAFFARVWARLHEEDSKQRASLEQELRMQGESADSPPASPSAREPQPMVLSPTSDSATPPQALQSLTIITAPDMPPPPPIKQPPANEPEASLPTATESLAPREGREDEMPTEELVVECETDEEVPAVSV